jgi:pimeloyl-ACP methyl ester carboxylesterase
MATLDGTALRDGYADLSEVRLHYVEAGEGPLVVLVHGFPEFWYGWRSQIPALVAAGFRVVAPDMRGYNLSSRPEPVSAYRPERLALDLRDLIHERGEESALVAGHDWGGAAAWAAAMFHPEVVRRLAVLNCPHPRRMIQGLRTPQQALRSWYMFFFQLPWLPEQVGRARDWAALRSALQAERPDSFTPADVERYVEAWSRPGALTAMLNYYRAVFRDTPGRALARIGPVEAPTLVIWGQRDRALGPELAEPDRADVPNLERVVRLPEASHWVQHDERERVNELLVDFFSKPA